MGVMGKITAGIALAVLAFGVVGTPVQAAGVIQGKLTSSQEVPTYERTITTGSVEYLAGGGYVDANDFLYALNAKDSTSSTDIIKFNPNGTVADTIAYPSGYNVIGASVDFVTGDTQGNLYVTARDTEASTHHVLKLSSTGTLLQVYGGTEENTQIFNPYGLTVDQNGNVYISHAQGYSQPIWRVSKFAANGDFVKYLDAFTEDGLALRGLVSDAEGVLYAVLQQGFESSVIRAVDSEGQLVRNFTAKDSNDQPFMMTVGLAIDQDGNLYTVALSEGPASQVIKYAPDGQYLGEAVSPHSAELYANMFAFGVDSKGAVYIPQPLSTKDIVKFSAPIDTAVFNADQPGGQAEVIVSTGELSTAAVATPESLGAPADSGNQYPLGILSFTAEVPDTNPVTVTYKVVSDLEPTEVRPRKYNATTKTYADITGATVTKTTLGGKSALQVSYSVADGSSLDEDGTVNGTIVDPVGLAVAATTPATPGTGDSAVGENGPSVGSGSSVIIPGAPNTGVGSIWSLQGVALAVAAVIMIGVGLYVAWRRYRNVPLFSKK